MTRHSVWARVVAVFDYPGERDAALDWVLNRLTGEPGVEDPVVTEIELTRWSDPRTKEVTVENRDGKSFLKYSLNATVTFFIEGGYREAQDWMVKTLMVDEPITYMNIQAVKMSAAEVPAEAHSEE
nr:MAG TPA: hypothetical protein [Caudoviricetes sp.]